MCSLSRDIFRPLEPEGFTKDSNEVVDFIADYYRDIEQYPVRSQVEPGFLTKVLPGAPPINPEPLDVILDDIRSHILPGLTHWQSPNFYAYFQANASTAGFLGEMLCTGLNVVGLNWISSPAATELESVVMDWMAMMLGLPPCFRFSGGVGGGVLHGSTCEAVVCTLAAARDRVLSRLGYEGINKLVVYASDQTNSTLQKGSKLVGIPPSNFRSIPTSAATCFALDPNALRSTVETDIANGLTPLYLCATIGTTAVGAVDPLAQLGVLAQEFGVWFHVDAAYGGSSCVCPEFRHYFDGVELADSISMNPHKWFLTNMDCCCLWVKNPGSLIDSLSTKPEYLKNKASDSEAVIDYKDWQIPLSRRFRAMKLWVVIRKYGTANLREHIRSDVALAKLFERLVGTDERFEVLVPRRFALVCFRLKPKEGDDGAEVNGKLIEAVNSSGSAFMTHAMAGGKFVLRFAIGATLTEDRHVVATWMLIQISANKILRGY